MNLTRKRAAIVVRVQWVLGVTTVVMLLAFYVFAYKPADRRLSEFQDRINGNEGELKRSRDQLGDLPSLAIEVAQMRTQLSPFPPVSSARELANFYRDVHDAARRSGLPEPNLIPGELKRTPEFTEQPMVLSFEGDFHGVTRFLRELEAMPRTLRTTRLAMKTRDAWTGRVTVEMTLKLYSTEG